MPLDCAVYLCTYFCLSARNGQADELRGSLLVARTNIVPGGFARVAHDRNARCEQERSSADGEVPPPRGHADRAHLMQDSTTPPASHRHAHLFTTQVSGTALGARSELGAGKSLMEEQNKAAPR